jgi:hypothetical protein
MIPDEDDSEQAEHHPKEYRITVITTADDLDEKFPHHDRLRIVFDRALALVGGPGEADQFELHYGEHALNDLEHTLGELGREYDWRHHVELELVPKPVVV